MADFSKIGRSNVRRSKAHERRVAALLTEWSGMKFRRRRVEGRGDDVRVVELTGDVIPVTGKFLFSVEAKCEKGFSFDALLTNPRLSLFTTWLHQAFYDANDLSTIIRSKASPLLFFKPNPSHDWVAFSTSALSFLCPKEDAAYHSKELSCETCQQKKAWFPHLLFDTFSQLGPISGNISHSKNKHIVDIQFDPVIICRWKDFAANVNPKSAFGE